MSAQDRERILSKVELALAFPPRQEGLLASRDPAPPPAWLDPGTPWDPLQKEMEILSTRFHRAATPESARDTIRAVIETHGVRRALYWRHPLLDALGVESLLKEAGVEVPPSFAEGSAFISWASQADLGITAAEAVLVETGTLVVRTGEGQERSTSLIPPVHLAVIVPRQRLESVYDLVPLLRQWLCENRRLPSAVHLISGPSRTGDIEMTLVLGAHGPKVLHVLAPDPSCVPDRGQTQSA